MFWGRDEEGERGEGRGLKIRVWMRMRLRMRWYMHCGFKFVEYKGFATCYIGDRFSCGRERADERITRVRSTYLYYQTPYHAIR